MVRMPGHESSDLVTQKKTAHLSDIAASVRANLAEDASPARDHRSSRSRTRARPKRLFLSETELVNTQQTLACGSERGAGSDQR